MRKNSNISLSLVALLVTFLPRTTFSQPPEELPPAPEVECEEGDEECLELIQADEEAAPAQAPAPAPVAEPKAVEAPAPAAVPEDKTVKGISISPSVAIMPFGYDMVNFSGDGKKGHYYFELKPAVDFSTAFKTGQERTADVTLGYYFSWKEFMNKGQAFRFLENDLTGSMNFQWTPQFSTKFPAEFAYGIKAGADTNGDSGWAVIGNPTANFKINDQLSFNGGYELYYVNGTTTSLAQSELDLASDPASPPEDFFAGSLFPSSTQQTVAQPVEDLWISNNSIFAGTKYKVVDGTDVGFSYKYSFAVFSNMDDQELTAHYLTPSITQKMPWKGGSATLANRIRFRKYTYAVTKEDPTALKQDFQNRLTFELTQEILPFLNYTLFYQHWLSAVNGDNYKDFKHLHIFYTGVTFSF